VMDCCEGVFVGMKLVELVLNDNWNVTQALWQNIREIQVTEKN